MKIKAAVVIGIAILLSCILVSFNRQGPVAFFVSPDGNDANPGTKTAPFRSLQHAKSAVKAQLQKARKSITVNIKGGTYYLEAPVVFTSEDSGTKNSRIIYKAVNGEKPVFTGSRELKSWYLLNNSEKLRLLSPEVKGRIFVSDLKAAGINNYGDPSEIGARPELFCNGELQTLARWPNKGFVNAGSAQGATELPPTYIKKHGTVEGVFEYMDKVQDRWSTEKDVRLGGYWYWDWSDQYQKVEKIDPQSRLIYLSKPYHLYGYKDSLRYFGANLFSEIDVPGEWYLDRTDGLLYWFPPEGIIPGKAKVTLSVFDAPYMVEMKNCSNITLKGLSFQEGRGNAISITDGNNCLVSNCRVERFGTDGIHIIGGTGHGISGSLLSTFGCGGIKIKGGDRKSLTPANHFVENTVVEYFSLFKRTYEPAIHLDGCGINIRNNRFQYSSSSAMRLEGNDFIIENNEISHVVNESDDQGGIDICYNPSYRGIVIRNNRWSDIKGGTLHGAAGVRLDDMISGVIISGNIFERCGAIQFGGVQIHGGKDNMVSNNLFFNCVGAVSFSPWGEKRWLEELGSPAIKKKIFEDVDIRSAIYQKKYSELKNIRENIDVNTVKNNLIVDCENIYLRNHEKQVMENNTSIQSAGESVEYFCSAEVLKKYGLAPIALQKIGPRNNQWLDEAEKIKLRFK